MDGQQPSAATQSTLPPCRHVDEQPTGTIDVAPPRSPLRHEAALSKLHFRKVYVLVGALALLFGLEAGVESGIGPCTVTALHDSLGASITAITAAQTAAEFTKMAGSFVVAWLTTSAATQVRLVAGGGVVWVVGCVVIGSATHVAVVGAGFLCLGLGYSFIAVLAPAIVEFYVVPEAQQFRATWLLSLVYTGTAVGVAAGFLACGATADTSWRAKYLAPALFALPLAAALVAVDGEVAASRRAVVEATPNCNPAESRHNRQSDAADFALRVDPPPGSPDALSGGGGPAREFDSGTVGPTSLKPSRMPWWRIVLHTRLLLSAPRVRWSAASQAANLYYLTAYIILMPTFLEEAVNMERGTVSIVMAAIVPATVVGLLLAGIVVRRYHLGLDGQLRFIRLMCFISAPLPLTFFLAKAATIPFLILFVVGLVVVFSIASPSRTIVPLLIDEATLSSQLPGLVFHHHAVSNNEGIGGGQATVQPADECPAVAPAATEEDITVAREVLVAHCNAVLNLTSRLFGSVLGPVSLAVLIDAGMPMPAAFALVGVLGASLSAAAAHQAVACV